MKKLTLHRVHRVTTFVQVKQRDKLLNGTKHMKTTSTTIKAIEIPAVYVGMIVKTVFDVIHEVIEVKDGFVRLKSDSPKQTEIKYLNLQIPRFQALVTRYGSKILS